MLADIFVCHMVNVLKNAALTCLRYKNYISLLKSFQVSGSGVPNGYLGLMIQLVKSKTFYDVKTLVKIPRPRLFLFYFERERGIHTCKLGLHDSLQRIPIF